MLSFPGGFLVDLYIKVANCLMIYYLLDVCNYVSGYYVNIQMYCTKKMISLSYLVHIHQTFPFSDMASFIRLPVLFPTRKWIVGECILYLENHILVDPCILAHGKKKKVE